MKSANDARLHAVLGEASRLIAEGRLARAREACDRALALAPGSPDAHMLTASLHEQQGDPVAAINEYRAALELDPRHLASWVNLGVCQKERGHLPAAIDAFERAVDVAPDNLTARYNLARAFYDADVLQSAIEQFEAVLRLRPDWAEVECNIGEAYNRLNRADEAIAWFRKSLRHQGDKPTAYVGIGHAYQTKGDFVASEKALRDALAVNPLVGRAYKALTIAPQKPEQAEADLRAIRKALDGTAVLSPVQRAAHNVAAFRILDRKKQVAEAFGHLAEANRIRAEEFPAAEHVESMRTMTEAAHRFLTRDFFAGHLGNGNPSTVPVFVVGMPRSGSTLTEQIVASHPEAAGAGELPTVAEIYRSLSRLLGRPIELPRQAGALSAEDLGLLSRRYLDAYPADVAGARRVVDKCLPNVFHVGLIKLMFPNARIVLCQRDAMDVCWSCHSTGFGGGIVRYAADLGLLAEAYRLHKAMMDHWQAVLPGDTMVLRYETLLSDFENEARRLIDFVGLDWNDACLSFHETERDILTASLWQVRQPLYQTSVGKWRPYAEFLEPLREALAEHAPEA